MNSVFLVRDVAFNVSNFFINVFYKKLISLRLNKEYSEKNIAIIQ